eukprot:9478256-Pyramimonas_sp.AAC.2
MDDKGTSAPTTDCRSGFTVRKGGYRIQLIAPVTSDSAIQCYSVICGGGVVWSSGDTHRPQHRLQRRNQVVQCNTIRGILDLPYCSGNHRQLYKKIPRASLRVECLAGFGALGVSIVGERETPVYCKTTDRQEFTPRVIHGTGGGITGTGGSLVK